MDTAEPLVIPAEIVVQDLLQSRYEGGLRPESWDERVAGYDYVLTSDRRRVKLFSEGGQSPPKRGWKLVLRGGNAEEGYSWTLYGFSR